MRKDEHLMSMHVHLCDAGGRMAAAAEQSIQQSIADIAEAKAEIREAKEQLQGATGAERVAIQQQLATLQQQLATLQQRLTALQQRLTALLLMQQQSGATGWAHSQGAGLLVASLSRSGPQFVEIASFASKVYGSAR
jgi:chromosome segregation ATPase